MATRTKHPRLTRPAPREKAPDQKLIPGLTKRQFERIGQVIVAWAHREVEMQRAIWVFLSLSEDDGRLVTARMDARPKGEWLRALGERYLEDGPYAASFFEALSRITDLQDDRNFIVHGVWQRIRPPNHAIAASMRKETAPGQIIAETFPDERMGFLVHDISVALKIISDVSDQLSALRDKS
jgi:hypothetical protein